MKVNVFAKEPMKNMTMCQPLQCVSAEARIDMLLFPSMLGSFITGELTVLTANMLIRMYSSLPEEWQIISVCNLQLLEMNKLTD